MSTGTELIENTSTSEDIRLQAEQERQSQTAVIHGRLSKGENVGGFSIIEVFNISGAEAELYYCEQNGIRYALKYFYNKKMGDDEIMQKLKGIKHPNIMSLVHFGEHNGCLYNVLELAEGGALSDKIDGRWKYLPLSEEKAIEAVDEIIEGFNTVHGKGLIHRDIKPDNLFYRKIEKTDSDESAGGWIGSGVMLGDFGISSLFQADEGMTSHYTEHDFATEGYEAPEMYAVGKDAASGSLRRRISPAIDYYALGITVWVLLTGKEPFVDEKGNYLSPGQIRRNAMNRQTADILISRSPKLSEKMKKLIRGLLVARHKDRWDYQKIKDHFAGKDVEVFQEEVRDMPPLEFAGKQYRSFIDISRAFLANPKEAKKFIFGGKLHEYMLTLISADIENAEEIDNKIISITEDYSAQGREDEGLFIVAYSLTPNLPYTVGVYKDETGNDIKAEIKTMADIQNLLESHPELLVPVLRDRSKGFYSYFEVQGYGEAGKKVEEVVSSTRSDLRLIPRLQAAFRNNVIKPFNDKVNDNWELNNLEDLEKLPAHLKARLLIFIEMKRDDVTAWVENLSGKDLDIWLDKYKHQAGKDWLKAWGAWKGFQLFLNGKDRQWHRTFETGEGDKKRWGLKNKLGDEILAPVWEYILPSSPPDRYIVKKNGKWGVVKGSGEEVISISWDLVSVFNEERGFYQCKDDKGTWLIVDENNNVIKEGKEALKVIPSLENPFDIIYDSSHYYNNETLEPVNKEGVKFAIVKGERKNYIAVIEEREGKYGVVSDDGSLEYIPFNFEEIKAGGNYLALFMPGKAGGVISTLVESQAGSLEKKDVYWLKLDKSGIVEILPVGGGQAIASFKSAAHLGLDYNTNEDFAPQGKIACLGDSGLCWFDIATGKVTSRNEIVNGEASAVISGMEGAEVFTLLQALKKQESFKGLNQLITAAGEIDIKTKTSWAMEKGKNYWSKILDLLEPDKTDGLSHSYDVYLSWKGVEASKNSDFNAAAKYFEEAIAFNSDIASYYAGCGAANFHLNNFEKSQENFGKAAALSKFKSITCQYIAARGSVWYSSGKYNEALAAFTQAINELGAQATAELYRARAACYQKLKLGDKARPDIAAAAKAQNNSGENIRGIPLPSPQGSSVNIDQVAASGNIQTIMKALDTLKTEGSIAAMNALIDASWQIFYNQKEYGKVVDILKLVSPQTAQGLKYPAHWYINLSGICLYSLNKYSEAVGYFTNACQLAPREGQYFYNCGNAYYAMKNWPKAAECQRQAVALGYAKANEELNKLRREGKA